MALLRRQKLTVIPLLLYWPTIFILTHIPPASVPCWVVRMHVSDKAIHYLAYLVLVVLLWFAISPGRKVNWRKAAAWWVLFVVVWYGVFDEWLQSYVGRNPDVRDFLANLTGTLTGLVLLSIFPFWSVWLAVTGAMIFVLTNFTRHTSGGQVQPNLADQLPVANAAFHLFAYAFFSLLWTRFLRHLLPVKAPEPKWLIGALALPMGFLLAVELFSAVAGNDFRMWDAIISAVGIVAVVAAIFLTALFRRGFAQKLSPSDS